MAWKTNAKEKDSPWFRSLEHWISRDGRFSIRPTVKQGRIRLWTLRDKCSDVLFTDPSITRCKKAAKRVRRGKTP